MDTTVIGHIHAHLHPDCKSCPLFIAIQGPQGSGKSFLTAEIKKQLSAPPYSLNVVVLSIDDLYLPHDDLVALASQNPPNPLWAGRGQPGTHDVNLGMAIFQSLRSQKSVELPIFDKSLFGGEGDRLPHGVVLNPPIDIVILEGWCVGFCPISQDELVHLWNSRWKEECRKLSLPDFVKRCDVEKVNEALKSYTKMWSLFDLFVQIRPASPENGESDHSIIYQWRLEQEQTMKTSNGGRGMSDEAVKRFVDRYIPGYVFFDKLYPTSVGQNRWTGKNMRLLISKTRQLVQTQIF